MQAVAYYVDLLQYEVLEMTTIEPPFTLPQSDPGDVTATPPTSPNPQPTTGTTEKPVQIATTAKPHKFPTIQPVTQSSPTASHAPGYYAPVLGMMFTTPPIQMDIAEESVVVVPASSPAEKRPVMSIQSNQFFNWFLQNKDEEVAPKSGTLNYSQTKST